VIESGLPPAMAMQCAAVRTTFGPTSVPAHHEVSRPMIPSGPDIVTRATRGNPVITRPFSKAAPAGREAPATAATAMKSSAEAEGYFTVFSMPQARRGRLSISTHFSPAIGSSHNGPDELR
jgi:hypothetical protein